MRRTQNRPQTRYMPYAPMIGPPVPRAIVPMPTPNIRVLHPPVFVPSPYNPHHRLFPPIGPPANPPFTPLVAPYCPAFPHFPIRNKLTIGSSGKSRTLGNKRSLREVAKHTKDEVSGKLDSTIIKKSRRDYKPVKNVAKPKPVPPPPPPLSELFSEHNNKTATPNNPKIISSTAKDRLIECRSPLSPEKEQLKLHIVAVVKKLLKNKKLEKRVFKFVCKHCTLNLFSILSAKKDISKPAKMIQMRMAKIAKLVDEECHKIVEHEKSERTIPTKNSTVELNSPHPI